MRRSVSARVHERASREQRSMGDEARCNVGRRGGRRKKKEGEG